MRLNTFLSVFGILVGLTCLFCAQPGMAGQFYVSPAGNDSAEGSESLPWQTLQHALNQAQAGDTIFARSGEYPEKLVFSRSGSTESGPITLCNYPGEAPVLEASTISVSSGNTALVLISNLSHIVFKGFTLRNYQTSRRNYTPIAILITGTSSSIAIEDNIIHDIASWHLDKRNAHAIAVFGTHYQTPISEITISGNTLYDLTLGSSEALVLNGNVQNFSVTLNTIYNADNIGLDAIGFEGVCPTESLDQARNGIFSRNTIYSICSYDNPAYGQVYAAGGIYIDGGRDIVVERNLLFDNDFGIEVASEHSGKASENITLRNNIITENRVAGLAMGGYRSGKGETRNCTVINNTFFNNNTLEDGSGEIYLQHNLFSNSILNNIISAGSQGLLIASPYEDCSELSLDYNLYFSPKGRAGSLWNWQRSHCTGFSEYREDSGQDKNSWFASPRFADSSDYNFRIKPSSPAIDRGINGHQSGTLDYYGMPRVVDERIDIGALEGERIFIPVNSILSD